MPITQQQRFAAWLVHAFTASTAVIGVYTLYAIVQQQYILAFWLMGAAIFIDAVDGTLARLVKTHLAAPKVDGALLDNVVDYINYVITPAFFLLMSPTMLSAGWRHLIIGLIVLTSAYQFTQRDAKTDDHFFKGFPCYWNFAVFYLFLFQLSACSNSLILITLAVLIFVPIKYVYPSRLDYLTHSYWLRRATQLASFLFGLANMAILATYPQHHPIFVQLIVFYILLYFAMSLYRTFVPLKKLAND